MNPFGWRMYDPEVGVWSGADPAEQDWNVYAYCGGNSINFVDPDGLESSSSEGDWSGCITITNSDGSTQTICTNLTEGGGDGSGGGTTDKILGGSTAHNTGPSPDYQGPVRGPVVQHLRFEAAPPLKPMTNGDVAGLGKALLQGAMPGAPVQEGGGAAQASNYGGYTDEFANAVGKQMQSSLTFGRPAVGTLMLVVGAVLPGLGDAADAVEVAQTFTKAADAIGDVHGVAVLVGKAATKSNQWRAAGYKAAHYYTDSAGKKWTVFYNKAKKLFSGAHGSSGQ